MANAKEFSLGYEAGATVYLTVQRKEDGYLMDDADGAFKVPPVSDFALAMNGNAVQPSLYEIAEDRVAWTDGIYIVCFYRQLGVDPAPTADIMIASKDMTLVDDAEVSDSGDTTINTSSTTTTTTDQALVDITKLVKAMLHDNKMVLDKFRAAKGGFYGDSNSREKEGGASRRRY